MPKITYCGNVVEFSDQAEINIRIIEPDNRNTESCCNGLGPAEGPQNSDKDTDAVSATDQLFNLAHEAIRVIREALHFRKS